ncbi:hypothetical protein WJX73_002918 [Symbiochloris irregularis]|uniref:Patatin n=1 Tax=Symbiochloris irregularis TaxID=706552 RepID=A0AAW1PNS0_9CHLO
MGILKGDTPLAGASAGSLLAACHHCQLETSVVTDACLALADNCRQGGTRGRLGRVLKDCLEELLPEDCHERLRGKAFISVTRAFPVARNELLSEFKNKDDVIEALMTSCHIPLWFDNSLMTRFRGALHYDGGLTNFIPLPPTVPVGIRVCCLPAGQLNTVYPIDITPDSYEDWPYSASEMLSWAFEPADKEVLYELIAKGRKDARAWALQTGAAEAAGGETAVRRAKGDMDRERYPVLKQ